MKKNKGIRLLSTIDITSLKKMTDDKKCQFLKRLGKELGKKTTKKELIIFQEWDKELLAFNEISFDFLKP